MPKMGESITEGTILRWLKKEGDTIQKDEPILEISTDKVDTEVPSPVSGKLLRRLAQEGETVAVGNTIAEIGAENEAASAAPATSPAPPSSAPQPVQENAAPQPNTQPEPQVMQAPDTAQAASPVPTNGASGGAEQQVVMPKMGESITEGTILRWIKKVGDKVAKDEPILEISTDKVDTEVPSPFAGTLTKQHAKEGEVVAVGAPVASISTGAAAPAAAPAPAPQAQAPQAAKPAAPAPQATPAPSANGNGAAYAQPSVSNVPQGVTPVSRTSGSRFYSPLVRSIAKQEGISLEELNAVQGSGLEGRVNKNDILSYVQNRGSRPATQPAQAPTQQPSAQPAPAVHAPKSQAPAVPALFTDGGNQQVIPMDNIRQKIAEHMVRSKHTSAHVTSVSEVDMTNVVRFREKFKDEFKRREGINLTYTPIMIEAMVRAIKDFPFINAMIEGNNIVVKKDINFGVAVSLPPAENSVLPPALIVPVIKRAGDLNLVGLSKALNDLAARARNKKLAPDDISGGTFTLTNPGMYGNLFGTPIINQPQLAIMTTGAIVKKAVVKTDAEGNDYIAIRSMMYLGLSYDHRLIDGMYGVQFTERVKEYLENWRMEM